MILRGVPSGMFASQIVVESKGALARGTVYDLLYKMEGDRLLKSELFQQTSEFNKPRPRYWMTVGGERKLLEFLDFMGLEPKEVKA